jgi:hypothetical protein
MYGEAFSVIAIGIKSKEIFLIQNPSFLHPVCLFLKSVKTLIKTGN